MGVDYVEISLDRPRRIKFGVASLRDLQRRLLGTPLVQVVRRMQELDLDVIVTALWVGLRWDDGKIKPDDVERLIQEHIDAGGTLGEIVQPLSDAFVLGAGLERRPEGGGEGKVAPGTGAS